MVCFQALLGQKYGYVDLPSELSHDVFEPIRFQLVKKHGLNHVGVLEEWYRRDLNSNPPHGVYLLQPISTVLSRFIVRTPSDRWVYMQAEIFARRTNEVMTYLL